MSPIAVAFSVSVGGALAAIQAAQGFGYALRLLKSAPAAHVKPPPRVLVVLCLRGADPFLPRCIHGLLAQDYANFDVVIVIDHLEDAAWRQAAAVVESAGATNVRMESLEERLPTCSLKCSALLQAWSHVDEGYDVVANIDADVVPHRTWLTELVAALAPADVAVATGNRWYMPGEASLGALTRYFWNSAAIVPMYWYSIAWGGTLAFKADVVRSTDYRRRVSHALCEDTMLADLLRGTGRRIAFVPELIMVNREDCTIREFYSWMRRQSLNAKLYHSRFPIITTHGLIVGVWMLVTLYAVWQAVGAGDAASVRRLATIIGIFLGSMFLILPVLELAVRRIVARRGESATWITPQKLALSLAAGGATLVLYVTAIISLLKAREIRWRGIRYRVSGPFQIERLDDGVYQPLTEAAAATTQSL